MEDPRGSDSGGSYLRIHPLWLVLIGALLWSAPASATKYAGAFMEDGGGARALGMGSAFVAVADDASAAFFNPAGIVDAQRVELMLMHSERFGDLVDRDYFSYVQPLRGEGWAGGAFAISLIHLAVDDIPITSQRSASFCWRSRGTSRPTSFRASRRPGASRRATGSSILT